MAQLGGVQTVWGECSSFQLGPPMVSEMTFTAQHRDVAGHPGMAAWPTWFGMQRCHCLACGFLVFAYVGTSVNGNCPDCGSSHLVPVGSGR
jgi:hypothetical protein